MSEIIIRTSLKKSMPMMLGCVVFVLLGALMVWIGKAWWHPYLGGIGIAFFGLGFFVLLRQVADRSPRIIIDDLGVTDRTLSVGRIDWDDITDVELQSINKTSFICLHLADAQKYTDRLSKVSKKLAKANLGLGFSQLNLNLNLIDMDSYEVFDLVNDRIMARDIIFKDENS